MAKQNGEWVSQGKKRWQALSENAKLGIVGLAAVEITLLVVAQAELLTSDRERVRGKKWLWFFANFVNFFGPISFLVFGRRRSRQA